VKLRVALVPFGALMAAVLGCSPAADKSGATSLQGDANADGADGTGFDPDSPGFDDVNTEAALDPERDNDGDGYLFKEDCDDRNPMVNPGAYDVPGDGVDNDCDGSVDNVDDCDTAALKLASTNALDFAKALGICRTTTEGATGKDKRWGVIKAELVAADGLGKPNPVQYGIETAWGPLAPRQGKNLVVLSSGTGRTPGQPGFQAPLMDSWSGPSAVTPPAGFPKNAAGCPDPSDKTVNDSVNLKLTIRVPTNAKAFLFNFDFYSAEYIDYVCSEFNDSFVAILDTKAPIDPKFNKNICFDTKGNPINVNSGFFEVCTPGTSSAGKSFPCAKGTKELKGPPSTGYWDDFDPNQHGATSWLETKAPVVPGETITLQFIIWDTGDHILDSAILLDNFRWDAAATTGPVTDRPK
jgi:hypothetical protein